MPGSGVTVRAMGARLQDSVRAETDNSGERHPRRLALLIETTPVVVRTKRFGKLELKRSMTIGDAIFLQELEQEGRPVDDRHYTVLALHRLLIAPDLREEDLGSLTDWVLRRIARVYLRSVYPRYASAKPSRVYESFRSAITSYIRNQAQEFADALRPLAERFRGTLGALSGSIVGHRFPDTHLGIVEGSFKVPTYEIPSIPTYSWPLRDVMQPGVVQPSTDSAERTVARESKDSTSEAWSKVQRQVERARERLADASAEEDFQSVGHLCREILISLAEAVYVRERHPPVDGVEPSATDAKRRLEAYIAVELAGSSRKEARKSVRAIVGFAASLQHDRNATETEAAACLIATEAVVDVIEVVEQRT